MARAIAYTRQLAAHPGDVARAALVAACALALIGAGQVLPF
jgi:hypothetical protein